MESVMKGLMGNASPQNFWARTAHSDPAYISFAPNVSLVPMLPKLSACGPLIRRLLAVTTIHHKSIIIQEKMSAPSVRPVAERLKL